MSRWPDTLTRVLAKVENLRRSMAWAGQNVRKTTCPRGHQYDVVTSKGGRACKQCAAAHQRAHRARKYAITAEVTAVST